MHRVTLHHECLVDSHIARLECPVRIRADLRFDFRVIEEGVDPSHLSITQLAIFLWVAFTTGVVWVQTRFYRIFVSASHLKNVEKIGTYDRAVELLVTVHCSRDTRELGGETTAGLDEPLARGYLAPQGRAFPAIRVIVDWVWTVAEVIRNASHLNIVVRHAVCKNDGREVDLLQPWSRC